MRRIAVIEDDADMRGLYVALLSKRGYEVTPFKDGGEYLDYVGNTFDLAIVDLMLPGIDGLTVIRATAHACPSIAVTAADTQTRVEALLHGAVAAIQKPFMNEQLLDLVDGILYASHGSDPQVARAIHRLKELDMPISLQGDLLAEAVNAMADGVIIADADGLIVFINTSAELMFGYPREEIGGKAVEILVPEQLREQHAHYRQSFMDDPRARPMGFGAPLSGRRKNGTEFTADIALSPLVTKDGIYVVVAVRRRREIAADLKP